MRKKKIVVLILFVFATVMMLFLCVRFKKKPITEFTTENWLSVESDQRYHMLEDLFAKVELVDMSQDEVKELLGEYHLRYGEYWGYTIRDDWWEGDEYLLIKFKDGIVVGYEFAYGGDL